MRAASSWRKLKAAGAGLRIDTTTVRTLTRLSTSSASPLYHGQRRESSSSSSRRPFFFSSRCRPPGAGVGATVTKGGVIAGSTSTTAINNNSNNNPSAGMKTSSRQEAPEGSVSAAPLLPTFDTIVIHKGGGGGDPTSSPHVAHVVLNRPKKRNAMNGAFWKEFREAFDLLGEDGNVRVIVVRGEGKAFTSGLDLTDTGLDFMGWGDEEGDVARRAFRIRKHVAMMQEAFNAVERAPQPVIAAVHGACIGAGVDLISACDVRLCTQDVTYSIREVQIGLAADMGTLQRLPRAVGNHSLLRELAYTGRNFGASEAVAMGLVSRVLPDTDSLAKAANELANDIANKSPVAVYGTKVHLNYSRDHTISEGLDYMTTWNMAGLQTKDLVASVEAAVTKTKPTFSKL